MTRTPDGHPTRHGLRRGVRAGTGALALSLLAAGCGGGGGDASPTGSNGTTASPGTSPAPTNVGPVFTLHDDFFPVPQADAADIPWDEVGPGWFLVDSHQQPDIDFGEGDTVRLPEAIGGLSLVSPEGEWYAARSFAGTGAAFSVHWASDGAWLMTGVDSYYDGGYVGDLVRLDLATGASSSIATGQWQQFDYVAASAGVTLVQGYSQDYGGPYGVYSSEGQVFPDCGWLATTTLRGDFRVILAPDGRTVVCWRGEFGVKTDVGTLDLLAPSAATYVEVFKLDIYHYKQIGWLSDDTFLLARPNDNSGAEAYFAYNVGSRTIEDFALPFSPGAGQEVYAFDYESQVYVSSDGEYSAPLDLHRANGEKIATVQGGCADGGLVTWSLSGTRLLTSCPWAGGAVTMIDLETGDVVGTWPYGANLSVTANGYPQHAD